MKSFFIAILLFSLIPLGQIFTQLNRSDSTVNLVKVKDWNQGQLFKVTQLAYEVSDNNLLKLLKSDQKNSFIAVGKIVSLSTFSKEKNRIFLMLSTQSFELKLNDIRFNVDTTLQKGSCTVVTIVRPEIN